MKNFLYKEIKKIEMSEKSEKSELFFLIQVLITGFEFVIRRTGLFWLSEQ